MLYKYIQRDNSEVYIVHNCGLHVYQNIRGSAMLRPFVGNIFVVAACTAGKGRQGLFICG